MLTPEGKRMLRRVSRYNYAPSPRGFYMIVASLVLLMLWAWSVSAALMALVAILGGVLVALFILGIVLRKLEGMESANEKIEGAMQQAELQGEIERVSGFGNDYTTKL